MSTRAKFRCDTVEFNGDPGNPATTRTYKFAAVYDPNIPEDQRFSVATPWGTLTINVNNPGVSFAPGSFYYLDVTPVGATVAVQG